ncbi:endo-1,4-beta-xylanase [Sphingobium sp. YR768]|uniref:endo-1,4-beta-xylanase n=1 Tax=Sphingobium sp. YR768 TaxID=1884365 RepID=UPI0008D75593|nr:endo-1,4-beta-xylanase [Sphingobium sp. YR768]SER31284.1 endo-1,4-beta-xylanase [Sphingobium sp. YR768]
MDKLAQRTFQSAAVDAVQRQAECDDGRRHPNIALSRRAMLSGILCSSLPAPLSARPSAMASLAGLAQTKGMLFGTSVGAGPVGSLTGMLADPRVMAIVDRECGTIVAENEMKQYVIASRPDFFDFAPGDLICDWAKTHGKKIRGHALLWNHPKYTPEWLVKRYSDAPASELADWLTSYCGTVAGHYQESIYAWDVVNETIDPATGELRASLFQDKLGFDAIRIAFEAAKSKAPHARRVYNDYMSWGAGSAKHRAGVLKLLRRFRAEQVPVDALGLQSHIGTEQSSSGSGGDMVQSRERERDWRTFLDEVVSMGYRLAITEFDVSDRGVTGSIKERDNRVASVAKAYLDLTLSYSEVDELLCWGMVDKYSWLQQFSPRADHQPLRPLPYGHDYRPKPLREAIAEAIRNAPDRNLGRV